MAQKHVMSLSYFCRSRCRQSSFYQRAPFQVTELGRSLQRWHEVTQADDHPTGVDNSAGKRARHGSDTCGCQATAEASPGEFGAEDEAWHDYPSVDVHEHRRLSSSHPLSELLLS